MNARYLPFLLLFFLTAGCSTLDRDPTEGWSAKKLFEEAKKAMFVGNYQVASEYLETLEARYPFGEYALQAQFELAYSLYKAGQYNTAISTLDRFIKEHPRNPRIDYAYYLRGLSHFKSGTIFFERLVPRDLSIIDQRPVQSAFDDFEIIVRNFPDSPYAGDARQRMIFLRNEMSQHEMHVAEYYYRRNAYVAVINRIKYMLERFDGAPEIPDALVLMAKSYEKMGMMDLADDTYKVLKLNFPKHPTLKKSSKKLEETNAD